jgi:hypothetical protein
VAEDDRPHSPSRQALTDIASGSQPRSLILSRSSRSGLPSSHGLLTDVDLSHGDELSSALAKARWEARDDAMIEVCGSLSSQKLVGFPSKIEISRLPPECSDNLSSCLCRFTSSA